MQLQTIIDQIKNGDLYSAMDAIKYLSGTISELKKELTAIETQLVGKVNTTSQLSTQASTSSLLGTGTVAIGSTIATGVDSNGVLHYVQEITGTSTVFLSQVQIGNLIKIGDISAEVFDIRSNTILQVICPNATTVVFPTQAPGQLFSIVRPGTSDELIGNYNFGAYNGGINGKQTFHATINRGSGITHSGNMSASTDLVNVGYVQSAINPVFTLAQRAILRDSDNINGAILHFTGGEITYNGIMTNDYDLVNYQFLKTYTSIATAKFLLTLKGMSVTGGTAPNMTSVTPFSYPTTSPLTIDATGIKNNSSTPILVNVWASMKMTATARHSSDYIVSHVAILNDGLVVSKSGIDTLFGDTSNTDYSGSINTSVPMLLLPGKYITVIGDAAGWSHSIESFDIFVSSI